MKLKSGLVGALASLIMLTSVDAFAELCSGRKPAPDGGGGVDTTGTGVQQSKGFFDCTLIATEKQCKNSYGTVNKSAFKGQAAPGSTAYKCRWDADNSKCVFQDKKCDNGNVQAMKDNPFK